MFYYLACTTTVDEINDMLKDSPGSLNFTMFLAMLGESLQVYSAACSAPAHDLIRAFECLDSSGSGRLEKNALRSLLTSGADGMTADEVEILLGEAPGDDDTIDYRELVKLLKQPI